MVTAVVNYGPIKQGHDYVLLEEGYDFYSVKVSGRRIYAFKWVFEHETTNKDRSRNRS